MYEFKVTYFIKLFLLGLALNFVYKIVKMEHADMRNGMMAKTYLHFKTAMVTG